MPVSSTSRDPPVRDLDARAAAGRTFLFPLRTIDVGGRVGGDGNQTGVVDSRREYEGRTGDIDQLELVACQVIEECLFEGSVLVLPGADDSAPVVEAEKIGVVRGWVGVRHFGRHAVLEDESKVEFVRPVEVMKVTGDFAALVQATGALASGVERQNQVRAIGSSLSVVAIHGQVAVHVYDPVVADEFGVNGHLTV